jgi:hypothetical protein
MLPGVTVELRTANRPAAPPQTSAITDATGLASGLMVKKGQMYYLTVVIGSAMTASPITGGTVQIDATGTTTQPAVVNMSSITLNWSEESDSGGKQLGPGTILPHGKNVYFILSNMPEDPDNVVISTISANGVNAQFIGPSGANHIHYLAVSGPGMLAMRVSIGTLAPQTTSATPSTVMVPVGAPEPSTIEGAITVGMRRTTSRLTEDVPLWVSIRKGTVALGFDRYFDFMNWVFCSDGKSQAPDAYTRQPNLLTDTNNRRFLPFTDTDAYRNIKVATEAFVMANCGVFSEFDNADANYVQSQIGFSERIAPDALAREFNAYGQSVSAPGLNAPVLPYLATIRRKLIDQRIKDIDMAEVLKNLGSRTVDECYGIIRQRLTCPCLLELIWSYWQEEGMLVQTMNALTRRFQNVRSPVGNDPLANMEIDPLRTLNNLIWGYIQDEQHRLTVVRRNYEYDHHYGLRLSGRAVRDVRTADSRSKFLEAFHTVLSITAAFYKRDDDTTIVADGFPVLNGLKEAHLILSEGAHNQYGDLPSTARIEMLMQQWMLARPEFREFLPTRIMVAYPEPWMDRVDAMKKLQGWTDTSVLHFRNLAIFGEQVLLGIRYGAWANVNDPAQATNWARYWRPEIQGYMHAYRSVTGVDLSVDVTNARIDATLPSVHLVQRLTQQQRVA